LQQIYSGNGVQNFIRIAQVLWKALQKNILVSSFWTHCTNSGHSKPPLFPPPPQVEFPQVNLEGWEKE